MGGNGRSSAERHDRRTHAPSQPAQISVAILTPADGADAVLAASVHRALETAGVAVASDAPVDALVVVGGLQSRCFLDDASNSPGAVRADVAETVRRAHSEGQWIAAPGVAVAAVLKMLEPQVAAGLANRHRAAGGVAVFPGLRLVCLERPMQCEIDSERDAAVTSLVACLINEAAR